MQFENEIQTILEKFANPVWRELEIRRKWPDITKIDHAVILGENLYCFQTKFRDKPTLSPDVETIIMHGLKLAERTGKMLLGVVLVSKIPCCRLAFKPAVPFLNIHCNYEHNIEKLLTGQSVALWDHQNEVVRRFRGGGSFIVKHPTGTGKTVSIQACIREHRKNHGDGTVLWVTKYVDVILSQKVEKYITVCPQNFEWTGPGVYLTNTDQLLTYFRRGDVECVLKNTDLLIIDEAHGGAAEKCFEIFMRFRCRRIGFSATPFGSNIERNKKISLLFPDGVGHELSFFRAVEMGLIVAPTIYLNSCTDGIGDIIENSKTGYCILWASTCESAENWIEKIGKYNIYRNFGRWRQLPFLQCKNGFESRIHLIFCVGRCKEGFDMPAVDTVINLDTDIFNYKTFVQKMGRCVRNFVAGDFQKTECFYFQKYNSKMLFLANLIKGLLDEKAEMEFLAIHPLTGVKDGAVNGKFVLGGIKINAVMEILEFEEIKKMVLYSVNSIRKKNFGSVREYEKAAEKDIRLPQYPEKMKGWPGWEIILNIPYYDAEEIKKIYWKPFRGSRADHYEKLRIEKKDDRIPELRAALDKYGSLQFLNEDI